MRSPPTSIRRGPPAESAPVIAAGRRTARPGPWLRVARLPAWPRRGRWSDAGRAAAPSPRGRRIPMVPARPVGGPGPRRIAPTGRAPGTDPARPATGIRSVQRGRARRRSASRSVTGPGSFAVAGRRVRRRGFGRAASCADDATAMSRRDPLTDGRAPRSGRAATARDARRPSPCRGAAPVRCATRHERYPAMDLVGLLEDRDPLRSEGTHDRCAQYGRRRERARAARRWLV